MDSETGLYYNRFRYYDPEVGSYISQDPIVLVGGNPTLYGYVKDINNGIDTLGLYGVPYTGDVFRGNKSGAPSFSPTARDIAHFEKTGKMPGISTFNNIESISNINTKYKLGMEEAFVIDTKKLGENLSAVLDSKDGHVSIFPSKAYLEKNNISMVEALEDWKKGGDSHALSKNVQNAVTGTKCLS